MKTAIVQMSMKWTTEENTVTIVEYLNEAKRLGADVAVFPELANTGFHRGLKGGVVRAEVEASLLQIRQTCAKLQVAAVVGSPYFPDATCDKPYNAAVVINECGDISSVCPKIMDDEREATIFQKGHSRSCFTLRGQVCTTLICREIECGAEVLSEARAQNPSVIFWPGVFVNTRADITAIRAMAQELNAFIIQATWADWLGSPLPEGHTLGRSWFIEPSGHIRNECPANEPCIQIVMV